MADYKELWELRDQNQYLSEANQFLKDEFNNILTLLTDPETRVKIFSIADALICGNPVKNPVEVEDLTPIFVGTV